MFSEIENNTSELDYNGSQQSNGSLMWSITRGVSFIIYKKKYYVRSLQYIKVEHLLIDTYMISNLNVPEATDNGFP